MKVVHQGIMWYSMTFKDEHSQFTVEITKNYQNLKMYVERGLETNFFINKILYVHIVD